MSESETANGAGEFIRMDQGETVPAGASPGESGTASEFSEDNGEAKGEAKCKGTSETRGGDLSTGKVRKWDGVCQGEWGSGTSTGETGPGWAVL